MGLLMQSWSTSWSATNSMRKYVENPSPPICLSFLLSFSALSYLFVFASTCLSCMLHVCGTISKLFGSIVRLELFPCFSYLGKLSERVIYWSPVVTAVGYWLSPCQYSPLCSLADPAVPTAKALISTRDTPKLLFLRSSSLEAKVPRHVVICILHVDYVGKLATANSMPL